ncbi:MAG: aminotransferase class I/II-fold pyridoxal phosphate-dependent enzyme, partial [Clostridia bacterium]|nr:aminotransferase class I/II-fold pyridoxal phosphate-dependent enzyme [Clostridia bacterium]
ASLGGYMAASAEVVDFVRHNSRPFIFAASIPPTQCAVALAALRHIKAHPELVSRLGELSNYARNAYKRRGVEIIEATTPIIPIYTYEPVRTLTVAKALFEAGVYVNPVLPPAAPAEGCLLRTSYMASLTEALIDEAADIVAGVLREY